MKASAFVLLSLLLLSGIPLVAPPVHAATPAIVQTTNPPSFGVDVGPAKWSFGASKFSWASGASNVTMNLPSLTVAVASVNCAVAQAATFSHNASAYIWTFSGASACNGRAIATAMTMLVKNVTGAYNQKEIIVSGSTTRTGSTAAVSNAIAFSLVSAQNASVCNTTGCVIQQFGGVAFDWGKLGGFAPTYNNATHVLTVVSASSTASVTTYEFDPLALDGSAAINTSTAWSTGKTVTITTASTPDVIILLTNHACSASDIAFTFTDSNSVLSAVTQRGSGINAGGNGGHLQLWYATTSATTNNDVITVKFTGACGNNNGGVEVFGVSGANTTTIFDSNAGLPFTKTGTGESGGTATVTTTLSTSNANDFIFADMGGSDNGHASTFGAAQGVTSTQISFVNTQNSGWVSDTYGIVAATQSGATCGATISSGNLNFGWGIFCDAVMQASATVSQAIKITTAEGAPSATITISGCVPSNGTFTANGNVKHYSLSPSCTVTLTNPATCGGGSNSYCFSKSPKPTASASVTFQTCASGTCTEYDNTTYNLLLNNFNVTPQTPNVWDGSYLAALTGTYLGVPNNNVCVSGTPKATIQLGGSINICQGLGSLADYNQPVSVTWVGGAHTIGNTWIAQGNDSFADTSANHTHNIKYVQSTGGISKADTPWIAIAVVFLMFSATGAMLYMPDKKRPR